jgi:D-aminopeptidase
MQNSLLDVAGLTVGSAEDLTIASGVTAIIFDEPAIAAVSTLGGAPGTRDTTLLDLEMTVAHIDALVLSGGSAFGLDAAGGVQAVLREKGRGFRIGAVTVPIVPQVILFDLLNGGDKNWGRTSPYFRLGMDAADRAGEKLRLGSAGAGYGATVAGFKGGLGTASAKTASGHTLAALVAVNAVGSPLIGDGPHFWAAPYEVDGEFGGLGWPPTIPPDALRPRLKGAANEAANTTIGIIATDAALDPQQAKRIALAAHDGYARALRPAHTPLDGDTIFAAATAAKPGAVDVAALTQLALTAADVMARAVARGVYEATALPFPGALPSWQDRFR